MLKKYTNLYFRNPLPSYQLKELGFSYPFSDIEPSRWMTYKFPVEFIEGKYGQIVPTLFGELMVDPQDMEVRVNVKTDSGTCYSSFYTDEYNRPKRMLDRIYRRIDKKLRELDIIRIKPKNIKPEQDEEKKDTKKRGKNNEDRTRNKKDGSTNQRYESRDKKVSRNIRSKKDTSKRRKVSWESIPQD